MKYIRIAKKCVRTVHPWKEISQDEFNEMIWNSVATEVFDAENMETDENGNFTDAYNEKYERFVDECYSDAEGCGFDAGDYYLYIRDDEFDMYDIPRNNC